MTTYTTDIDPNISIFELFKTFDTSIGIDAFRELFLALKKII